MSEELPEEVTGAVAAGGGETVAVDVAVDVAVGVGVGVGRGIMGNVLVGAVIAGVGSGGMTTTGGRGASLAVSGKLKSRSLAGTTSWKLKPWDSKVSCEGMQSRPALVI